VVAELSPSVRQGLRRLHVAAELRRDAYPKSREKGYRVRVVLTAAHQTDEDGGGPEPAPGRARRVRVLVVDDEPAIGRAIGRVLAPEHEVVVLTTAQEARDRIGRGERFDVILCDLMMPCMTGMDLHSELSMMAPDQAERMVLLTGCAFTSRAQDFMSKVANPRLEKPFDLASLRALIEGFAR
jgi:CheY-like chemotaxis protein